MRKETAEIIVAANAIALLIAVLFIVSWYGIEVLLLLFGGLLFAIFVDALRDSLSAHTPLGPRISVAIVLLAIGAAIALSA